MVLMPLSLSASMIRWKPSVISCSASAAAGIDFTAASAMGLSSRSHSVQIVGVFLNVLGKAERMIAHQFLGAHSVARFQRFDNVHVIADRTIDAILLADSLAAKHPHMRKKIFGEINHYAVAAQTHQRLVEFDIGFGILVEVRTQLAVVERGEHPAQRSDLVVARVLGN